MYRQGLFAIWVLTFAGFLVQGQGVRSTVDQPDDGGGYQVHALYVVPSDGPDRHYDTDGSISRSIASFEQWLSGQTGGRTLRLDTYKGNVDITFFRLQRSDAVIAGYGSLVRDQIEAELLAAGFDDPKKVYAVYYDGSSTFSCGGGPWPPALIGSVAAVYLRGTPPGAPPCDTNPFTSSVTSPAYREYSMIHEIMHTLGFVAACAPDQTLSGHVGTSPQDLMYAGSLPWQPSILDVNGKNYFRTGSSTCLDLDNSAFLTGTGMAGRIDPPPEWPIAQLAPLNCALESQSKSVSSGAAAVIQFVNGTGGPVEISWIDPAGVRRPYQKLAPGEGHSQSTFVGHYWIASDAQGSCINIFQAHGGGQTNFQRAVSTTTMTYYFPHLAVGGGWETTVTYVNYSPQSVSCRTSFYSDAGAPLGVPFPGGVISVRKDDLPAGNTIHVQTAATGDDALTGGWAQAQCTGPVKASLLYRIYSGGVAQGEAGVNASTTPTTEFATFAQAQTGIEFANPSTVAATLTVTALDSGGLLLGKTSVVLAPNAHGAANIGPLLSLPTFTGSVLTTSTVPIVALSLNAEVFPVFSSLPPGDLPPSTPIVTGSGGVTGTGLASTYYFPHLAFGGGWQTTLTYVNYSPQSVSCQTSFYSDAAAPLTVPFAGGVVSVRKDDLPAGNTIHVQTAASSGDALAGGWAQAQCTGPVKASLLYRVYNGGVAQGEAGVNASTMPTTEFATFAQTQTGVAYANPSAAPATVTVAAVDSGGLLLGSTSFVLAPNAHGAANIGPLLNLPNFTGSVQIISTVPIVSLSLNAEAFPVFSSLPPGDLPASTQLVTGH